MSDVWVWFISFIVSFIGGSVAMFFFIRNNPKYLGVDQILKALRDEYAKKGKAALDELKAKIEEWLKRF